MDMIQDKTVITRKDHKCWGCAETYPRGTKMRYTTTADQGELSSCYWCETCSAVISNLDPWESEDGFHFGEVKEHYPEEYQKEKNEES